MTETIDIPLGKLRRRMDARRIIESAIPGLMESIQEVGVIHPLRVRPIEIFESGRPAKGWQITVGGHRFEAASRLGLETVPCVVVDEDDLHAELAMIDENLRRANCSDAEEALAIKRRKEIYEELHPETRNGASGNGREKVRQFGEATERFTVDTAKKTGKSERSIQRDAARGEALGEMLKDITGTSLDKGVELDALVKLAPDQRADVIDKVKRGEIKSARQYEPAGPSGVDRDLKLEAARNMAAWLAEHSDASQWEWIKSTLYTAGAKAVADAFVNETGAGSATMDKAGWQ